MPVLLPLNSPPVLAEAAAAAAAAGSDDELDDDEAALPSLVDEGETFDARL